MTSLQTPAAAQALYERGWFSAFRSTHGPHASFPEFYGLIDEIRGSDDTAEAIGPYLGGLSSYHRSQGRCFSDSVVLDLALRDLAVALSR